MRIQELEVMTGLDRATIRYYEKENMITPQRRENGYRDYSEQDAQHLLKIKLLRQLGMSLDKIRALQQGSEDMGSVLQEQILRLREQQKTVQRSLDLCVQLRNDGVSYENMDPVRYLEQLTAQTPTISPAKLNNKPFHELVAIPYYPWRHLFARIVDFGILFLVVVFLMLVFYRTDAYPVMWAIANTPILLVMLPLEALCYKLFATTPGKYLFGIQVLHVDGCKHTFRSGFARAFGAHFYGYALGIPILNIWRMWKSFRNYEFGKNEWNRNSELIYKPYTWRQAVGWVLVVALILGSVVAYIGNVETAPYYGRPVTITEFSENFNHYYREKFKEKPEIMDENGILIQHKKQENNNVFYINGRIEPENLPDFDYEVKDGYLTGISCKDSFSFRGYTSILPKRYQIGILSLLASGEGENGRASYEIIEELKSAFMHQVSIGSSRLVYETEQATIVLEVQAKSGHRIGYYVGNEPVVFADEDGVGNVRISFSVKMK